MRSFMAIVAGLATVLAVFAAVFCSFITIEAARLPFNSEGRYFDGLVVHHDSAVLAYGVAAIAMWGLAIATGSVCRKVSKHNRN